jgi:signal transduction histidine kinase
MVLDRADFDVEATLRKAVGIVSQAARDKGLALMLDVEGLPAWANGDATRLGQALLNCRQCRQITEQVRSPCRPG